MLVGDGLQPAHQMAAHAARALQQVFLVKGMEHGQRSHARDRVACVGAAQAARGGGIHDVSAARHGRDGKAPGHRLGQGNHVWHHTALFDGIPGAGAACAGLHLIDDHHNAVLVAHCADVLQQGARGGVEAAFALHRLDDDGGHAAGLDIVFKDLLDGLDGIFHRHAALGVGKAGVEDFAGERAKTGLVGHDFARQRHGQRGAAVVSTTEGNHPTTAGVAAGNLDGVFHGFSAGGEQHGLFGEVAGGFVVQALGQLHIAFVGQHLKAGVGKALHLRLHRLHDLRMAVARVQHGDATGKLRF